MSDRYKRMASKLMAWARGDRYFPAEDSSGSRSFHLLIICVCVILAGTSAITIPFFVVRKFAALAMVATQLISLLISLRRLRRGRLTSAAWISLSTFWLSTELISTFSGGLRSPVQGVVFLIVIHAGWLLGRRGAWVFGGITAFWSTTAAAVEYLGHPFPMYLPLPAVVVLNWHMVTLALTLGLITILVATLQHLTVRALKSEARFATAFRFSPYAQLILDPADGFRVLDVNECFERCTGYAREEVIGQAHPQAVLWAQPAEFERFVAQFRTEGRMRDFEFQFIRKDREIRTGLFSAETIEIEGRPYIISATVDITERRRAEEERHQMEQQLRQAQKMESIGRLAGGVAHDFNNLLTVINGYSKMILTRSDTPAPLREQLDEIHKAGERAAGLTRQLLAFSRKQVLQPRPLDLNTIVADLRSMLHRLVGEDVDVEATLHTEPLAIYADPHQLEQVIMNLAVNARDAMPRGGRLSLGTSFAELDAPYSTSHPDVAPGRYAVLEVRDNGVGMDEATQQRIFEPFFTTKGVGRGTGLGLSMVEGIVKQSGGHIEVSSELGLGTSFKVYLPIRTAVLPSGEAAAVTPLPGRETILVVEDQAEVRQYAVAVLRAYGYQVIQAECAAEALEICQRQPNQIDLILTDVVMPQTSGRELMDTLSKTLPGIQSLFMSGYSDDAIAHHGVLEDGVHFIQKPFSPAELAGKIREVLASSGRRS